MAGGSDVDTSEKGDSEPDVLPDSDAVSGSRQAGREPRDISSK